MLVKLVNNTATTVVLLGKTYLIRWLYRILHLLSLFVDGDGKVLQVVVLE